MWGLLMFKRANLKRTWGLLMSTGPYGSYWLGPYGSYWLGSTSVPLASLQAVVGRLMRPRLACMYATTCFSAVAGSPSSVDTCYK